MIKTTFHKVEYTREERDRQTVDDLLWQRYCYAAPYIPNIGYRSVSANFRDAVVSKGGDEMEAEDFNEIDPKLMESVEFCMLELVKINSEFVAAIEREMKNRAVKAQVWRFAIKATYPEALDAALIAFRKGGLV